MVCERNLEKPWTMLVVTGTHKNSLEIPRMLLCIILVPGRYLVGIRSQRSQTICNQESQTLKNDKLKYRQLRREIRAAHLNKTNNSLNKTHSCKGTHKRGIKDTKYLYLNSLSKQTSI